MIGNETTTYPHRRRSRLRLSTALCWTLVALVVGSMLPATAFSQGWDDRDAFFGSGTLRFRGRTSSVIRLGVRRSGSMVNVRLRTQSGEVHVLDGRFKRDVSGGYEMDVHLLDDEEASGVLNVGSRGSVRTLRAVQLFRSRDQLSFSFDPDERAAGSAKPNSPELTLSESGIGHVMIQGRRPQVIERVSVRTRRDGSAEVTASGPGSLNLQLQGNVIRSDVGSVNLRLRSSGMADASGGGSVNFTRNRLDSIHISGKLDGQNLTLNFDRKDTSPGWGSELNLLQRGSGLLEIGNRPRQRLTTASVSIHRDGAAEIWLTQGGGRVLPLGGRVSRRDAYTVRIALSSSGDADASGFANISYGANGRINSLGIDGHMDGQALTVYFAP